ncbi:AP-3 complex subunit mu [Camellia lanceoleosa]|uniref:AP-3 complex subunit mu n=1 Tax=Camellia lanceoleosa TaxID=1840588 RepID=A0ACC0H9Z5_9ERIC|nr:AP-3 complex subunit mu [Camellia lanceoleosa]
MNDGRTKIFLCCFDWVCVAGEMVFLPVFFSMMEVMLEKQLTRHRVDRSICAWFWKQAISQGDSFKVPTFNSGSSNTQIGMINVLYW